MEVVTGLVIGGTAYIMISALFEVIFFNLYNGSFHPFAKILDLSEGSKGKLFELLQVSYYKHFNSYDIIHSGG